MKLSILFFFFISYNLCFANSTWQIKYYLSNGIKQEPRYDLTQIARHDNLNVEEPIFIKNKQLIEQNIKTIIKYANDTFSYAFSKDVLRHFIVCDNKLPTIKYQDIYPELLRRGGIKKTKKYDPIKEKEQIKREKESQIYLNKLQNVYRGYHNHICFLRGKKYLLEELHYLTATWHCIDLSYKKHLTKDIWGEVKTTIKYTNDEYLVATDNNAQILLSGYASFPLAQLSPSIGLNFFTTTTVKYVHDSTENLDDNISLDSNTKNPKRICFDDISINISTCYDSEYKEDKLLKKSYKEFSIGYVFDNNSKGYVKINSNYVWDFTNYKTKVLISYNSLYPLSCIDNVFFSNKLSPDKELHYMRKILLKYNSATIKIIKSCNDTFDLECELSFFQYKPRLPIWENKYKDKMSFHKSADCDKTLFENSGISFGVNASISI